MRLLGILVCLTMLGLAGYSAITYKAPEIQADIERRAAQSLAALEIEGVAVAVDGRHVALDGKISDDADRRQLLAAVAAVPGALGPIDRLEHRLAVSPYRFTAEKGEDGAVVIEGHAPDSEAKATIEADAASLFGDRVDLAIEVAEGAPSDAWTAAAVAALDTLATVRRGKLTIVDREVTLEGDVSSATDLDAIEIFAGMMPDDFAWMGDVVTPEGRDGGDELQDQAETGDEPATPVEAADADFARETVEPYSFSVVKQADGGLRLKGFAPDEATRAAMIEEGKAVSGDKPITADIQIADGMPDQEWPSLVQAGISAMKDMAAGTFEVVGNDVSFTKDAETAEADALDAAATPAADAAGDGPTNPGDENASELAAKADPEVVVSPVVTVEPMLTVDKVEEGVWSVSGVVPDADSEAELVAMLRENAGVEEVEVELEVAGRAADDRWLRFARERIPTLDAVRAGRLRLEDGEAHLIGVVDGPEDIEPVRAELAAIDRSMTVDLQPIDPRPLATLDLNVDPEAGVALNGVLPEGLTEGEALLALGIERFDGRLDADGRGSVASWRKDLSEIGALLPSFERIDLSLGGERARIKGEVGLRQDADAIARELVLALSDDSQPLVDVAIAATIHQEGDRRANPLSGADEVFREGYWLPVAGISADETACRERSAALLERDKITFLRGEADLDQRALSILNALAGLAIACLEDADLVLEIGGHTDSRGAAQMNAELSQARADAVLNALAARGVDIDALSAVGYGDRQPVADNDTDEGRAANRRITLEWKTAGQKARSGAEG